jgi:hypothetical protein
MNNSVLKNFFGGMRLKNTPKTDQATVKAVVEELDNILI